jgi:hypothetical protein
LGDEHHTAMSSTGNLSEVEVHFLAFVQRWQAHLDSGCNVVDAFIQSSPGDVISALRSGNRSVQDQEAVMASLGSTVVASGSFEEKRECSEWMTGFLESLGRVEQLSFLPQSMNAEADSVRRMVEMVLMTGTGTGTRMGATDRRASTVGSTPTQVSRVSVLPPAP